MEEQVSPAILFDLLNSSNEGFLVYSATPGSGVSTCSFANRAAFSIAGTIDANSTSLFGGFPAEWVSGPVGSVREVVLDNKVPCLIEKTSVSGPHTLFRIRKETHAAYKQMLWEDAEEIMQFGGWIWQLGEPQMEWTEGMYRLMGYAKADLDALDLDIDLYLKHVHPDDLEQFKAQVDRIQSYTDSYVIEFRIVAADGVEKYLYLRGENVLDEVSGKIVSLGTIFNVSTLKLIQSELEKKVSDLNKSNADLEQFAYVASHDLQEPLRKIVSFGERLSNKAKDVLHDEHHLYLDRILNATRRMQEMINNLLEFSRVSSASRVYVSSDLNEIMRSTLGDLELTIQQKGAEIELGSLPVMEVIPAQMSQLFLNLISNSLKFTRPDTRPVIRITASDVPSAEVTRLKLPIDNSYVRMAFSDNGIGFDNSSSDKIFTIFQRLRGRSEYEGAGIGLAVCKKVVERHHGVIEAMGVPDQGATFEIILPRSQN